MMLIVHGLPKITKFFEFKALLTQECNLSDFILDAFVTEEGGFTKQVKVGVATEDQGDNVFRVLDGYSFNGHILSVRGIGKDFHKTVKATAEFGNREVYDNSHSQPNPAYSQNVPQYSPMEVHKPQQRSYPDRDAHLWDQENNSNHGYNHGYSQNNPGIQHSGNPNITIPTHGHGQFSGPGYQQDHMPQNVQPAYQPPQQGNQWSTPNNQTRNMGAVPPMNNPNYQHNVGHVAPTPDNFDIPTRAYTNPSHSNQQMRHEPVLRDIKRASPDRRWDSERGPQTDARISSQGRGESQKGKFYRREESPSRENFRRTDVSPRNRDMRKVSPQRKGDFPPRFSPTQDFLKKNMEIPNRPMDKPFRRPAYEPTVNEVSNERPYGQQGKESWKVLHKDSMLEPEESRRPPETWNQKALDPWGKKSLKKTQGDDTWKQKPVQDRHEKERWSPKPQESWAQKKRSPPKEDWGKTPITIRSNKNRWNEGSHNDQEPKKSWEYSSKNVPRSLKSKEHPRSENNSRDRQENVSWECRPFEKQSNDAWKLERNETDRHSFESGREPLKFSKPNIPQVPFHPSRRPGRSRSPKEESSPKRSWAQERSRHSSPGAPKVAPPPPSWPGHHGEEEHYSKSRPKSPVWEIRNSDELKRTLDHFDIVGRSGGRDVDRPDWISRDGNHCSSIIAAHDENREAYRDSKLPLRDEFLRRSEHFNQRQHREEPDRHGYSHIPDARERENRKRKASPHLRKADEVPRSLVQHHKEMRIRAINNIIEKILQRKCVKANDFETKRLGLELRLAISVILKDIITDRETTLNNILDKYRSKFSEKDEDELFTEVISSFSQEFITNTLERAVERSSKQLIKQDRKNRNSADIDVHNNKEENKASKSRWDISGPIGNQLQLQPSAVSMQAANEAATRQLLPMSATPEIIIPSLTPMRYPVPMQQNMMVPMSFASVFPNSVAMINPSQFTNTFLPINAQIQPSLETQFNNDNDRKSNSSEYDLCFCKLDFSQFDEKEANDLRRFLVAEIFKASVNKGRTWTPMITMKGLQTQCRFEVVAGNEVSRKWLIDFDFSVFPLFDIALYTKEELWFERAAIWLPGLSKVQHLEPLAKLKLQNRCLDGVSMDKWKIVKKIITNKGTRIYVDIPPSSRQALEKYNMSLSYELVKVTVYMKSTTVDPEAFNAGLEQPSIDMKLHKHLIDQEPMPVLSDNIKLLKIGYCDKKLVTISEAKQIKDKLVQKLFQFHQKDMGNTKTDFVRYGFCHPGHFVVEPENKETENWLMAQKFGAINDVNIIAFGGESAYDKFVRFLAYVPSYLNDTVLDEAKAQNILQLLHKSNLKMDKLNVRKWKLLKIVNCRKMIDNHLVLNIDKESAATLSKQKRKNTLCFDIAGRIYTIKFKPSGGDVGHNKPQSSDSYVVTNMEIDSDVN